MKILKFISMSLIMLFSLLFSSATTHAASDITAIFNVNGDELNVTVKNNSVSEMSDMKYDFKTPEDYKIDYVSNPKNSLNSGEHTVFKVKLDKKEKEVANQTADTQNKEQLSKTGMTTKIAIGVGVLLIFVIGALVYFKKKKLMILIIVAGLGSLLPHYSLAVQKVTTTKNFTDIQLQSATISLDITYSMEENTNSSAASSNETTNKQTSANEQTKTNNTSNDAYAKVFADMNQIVKLKNNKDAQMNVSLNVNLNPWVIESIANTSNALNYAYYDINKDGKLEMLVGFNSGGQILTVAYYLGVNGPDLLGESYVASAGGARSGLTIYQDGSILSNIWSSGSGNGQAFVYKIQNDGTLATINSIDYERLQFKEEDLGLAKGSEININSLNWQSFGYK